MKRFGILSILAACLMCSTGFVEMTRLIKVNKNGSGSIVVRVLYNPEQLTDDFQVHDVAKLKQAVYGKGVRFVISKEVEGRNGWKGYMAKYHFSDVEELRIFPGSLPRAATADKEDEIRLSGWRFEFKSVEPVAAADDKEKPKKKKDDAMASAEKIQILEIVPLVTDLPAEEGGGGDDFFDEAPPIVTNEEPEDLALREQQKGRRYVTYVQVDGTINDEKSTVPAGYKSKERPNTVVLNDEQFENIWKSGPTARTEIAAEEPNFARIHPDKTVGYRTMIKKAKIVFK